jgi:hypothetical protein
MVVAGTHRLATPMRIDTGQTNHEKPMAGEKSRASGISRNNRQPRTSDEFPANGGS